MQQFWLTDRRDQGRPTPWGGRTLRLRRTTRQLELFPEWSRRSSRRGRWKQTLISPFQYPIWRSLFNFFTWENYAQVQILMQQPTFKFLNCGCRSTMKTSWTCCVRLKTNLLSASEKTLRMGLRWPQRSFLLLSGFVFLSTVFYSAASCFLRLWDWRSGRCFLPKRWWTVWSSGMPLAPLAPQRWTQRLHVPTRSSPSLWSSGEAWTSQSGFQLQMFV